MKGHYFLWIFVIIFIVSCGQPATTTQDEDKAVKETKRPDKKLSVQEEAEKRLTPGNPTFLSQATDKIIRLVADSTSYDEKFGESHRVLKIYAEEAGQEKELKSILLPVNASPDFRYDFADVYAEKGQEWLLIQGNYFFFVYDVVNDQLSKKVFPPKPKDFEGQDAQSGRIISLFLEKNKIKGSAQDIGEFVFSLEDLKSEFEEK